MKAGAADRGFDGLQQLRAVVLIYGQAEHLTAQQREARVFIWVGWVVLHGASGVPR